MAVNSRTLIGIAVAAYAMWLCVRDVQEGHWLWLILPLLLAALATWLIFVPKKKSAAQQQRENRYQAYLDLNPNAKKLENWSKWLGWGSVPLIAAWVYFDLETIHLLSVWWIFGIAFAFCLPSFILSTINIIGFYRAARARLDKADAP